MFESEAFYDSDEGVGSGPITFKEEKARLSDKNFINPSRNRRVTTFGRLEHPNSTEYLTAETSAHTNIIASDSSSEDTNASIKEAVSNVIKSLDNEIIEISDEEDESEIVYISSTSSTDDDLSKQFLFSPTFQITSPTLDRSQSISPSANIANLSDTEILQDLSALQLSPSEIEEVIKHKDSPNGTEEPLEESELASASAFSIDKALLMVAEFDNTLDRVNLILNYGREAERLEDCITTQRMPSVVVPSAPNTTDVASGSRLSKVPSKIPRRLRKEFVKK